LIEGGFSLFHHKLISPFLLLGSLNLTLHFASVSVDVSQVYFFICCLCSFSDWVFIYLNFFEVSLFLVAICVLFLFHGVVFFLGNF